MARTLQQVMTKPGARWYRWSEHLVGFPGWIEMANDWEPLRQIEKPDGRDLFSWYGRREDGCRLAEGIKNAAEAHRRAIGLGDIKEISAAEFEAEWKAALASRRDEWDRFRGSLPTGKQLWGMTEIFYPQGVIVSMGLPFCGLLSYEDHDRHFATRLATAPRGVKWSLAVRVLGFDDHFQWVRLGCDEGT